MRIFNSKFHSVSVSVLAFGILSTVIPTSTAESGELSGSELLMQADSLSPKPNVSPIQRIERDHFDGRRFPRSLWQRTIDGSYNNFFYPEMNASGTSLERMMQVKYADGVSQMVGPTLPNPRVVSNAVNAQAELLANPANVSDYLWQWGQFVDHDIGLTDGTDPPEPANIPIPIGDPQFDPGNTGQVEMPFNRSIYYNNSGTGTDNPRQQLNEVTGWIDGSQVYGSDEVRAAALRTNDGTGRLRTSQGDLLPFNTDGLSNAGGRSDTLFIAGDVRANEQVGLASLHTLFVREHNRLATEIAEKLPLIGGEQIYQLARRQVIAQLQHITYNEFIPALLGPKALAPYNGYNPGVKASVMNEFTTATFRFGHTLVNPMLLRLEADGNPIAHGHLPLRDAFFAPHRLIQEGGIDPVLRGLAKQRSQKLDVYIVDDLRNFLFGTPGQGGFDLASLNIQRGRDHGLPRYNDAREYMGLKRKQDFAEISTDPKVQQHLASVYASVDKIDFWVGGLAEDHMPGALVGELFFVVLKEQFEPLRDGDRFWYQRYLTSQEQYEIKNTRLADIIRRNTGIGQEIAQDVFHVQ